jgi:hypothetical protein
MQDARFVTNYAQRRTVDQYIRSVNKIESAQDYKEFLQKNGDDLINKERAYNEDNYICKIDGKCMPISNYPPNQPQPLPPPLCEQNF